MWFQKETEFKKLCDNLEGIDGNTYYIKAKKTINQYIGDDNNAANQDKKNTKSYKKLNKQKEKLGLLKSEARKDDWFQGTGVLLGIIAMMLSLLQIVSDAGKYISENNPDCILWKAFTYVALVIIYAIVIAVIFSAVVKVFVYGKVGDYGAYIFTAIEEKEKELDEDLKELKKKNSKNENPKAPK